LAVVFGYVVDPADVRVADLAGESDFLAESGEPVRILGEVRWEELECDGLAESQIIGSVDFPHAPSAERGDHAVTAGQQLAGREPLTAIE
jgi:hypothetical protein